MKGLYVLIYREWLEFKKKYIAYFLLWFLFPMILYLLVVIPLTPLLSNIVSMNYKYWSSPGIWISTSCLTGFIYSFVKLKNIFNRKEQLDKYLKAPISNGDILSSILISSVIVGIAQSMIAIFITIAFNSQNFNIGEFFIIFLNILTLLLFFSVLGLFFGFCFKDDFFSSLMIVMNAITLLVLSFFPIDKFSSNFVSLVSYFPIYTMILNTQSFLDIQKNFEILPLIITNIITVIMFITTLIISYNRFRK